MKSPERYFLELDQWSPEGSSDELSGAEKAFLKKYMGIDSESQALAVLGEEIIPAEDQVLIGAEIFQAEKDLFPDTKTVADSLREQEELQFVSFRIGQQEFVLPIDCVQEVVNYIEPTKLPSVSEYIAGVANLRGRVTPLVRLDRLLEKETADTDFKFIIVCRVDGLQVGLVIHSIATMYRIEQQQIDWGISSKEELVCGVIKLKEQLIGIIAIDNIVNRIVN